MFNRMLQKLSANGAALMNSGDGGGGGGSSSSSSSSYGNVTDRNGNAIGGVSNSVSTNSSTVSDAEFNGAIAQDKANRASNGGGISYGDSGYYSGGSVTSSDWTGQSGPSQSSIDAVQATQSSDTTYTGLGSRDIRNNATARRASVASPSSGLVGRVVDRSQVGVFKDMNGNTVNPLGELAPTVAQEFDKNGQKMGWEGYNQYLDINWSYPQIKADMVANGMTEAEADKAIGFQAGMQSAYGAAYDNNTSLNSLTDFSSAKNGGSPNVTKSIADAGNMYSAVLATNSPAVGPANQRQANFAFNDTYAASRKGVADYGAMVADAFVPIFSPAQGIVDAAQASAASTGILGQEMSTADKFAVGAKTAVPLVRGISNLSGPAQYDSYGKTPKADSLANGVGDGPQSAAAVREMVLAKDPNATEEDINAAIEAYGFGDYASHINKFSGGRNNTVRNNFTTGKTW